MNRKSCRKSIWAFLAASTLVGLVIAQAGKEDKEGKSAATAKYIGAEKCKSCHSSEAAGDPYGQWSKSGHAKAFDTLASDKAKEIAKAKGIADPQKSDACMKCHQTAFGVAAEDIKKGFDPHKGVQCESCHGPGDQHLKARFAAAAKADADPKVRQVVPAGEIQPHVEVQTCLGCHNPESPTYKPFCIHARAAAITHLDPRHERKEGKLICGCDVHEGCKHVCDDACGGKAAPK